MKCTEISADWAVQRIQRLSLASAVWSAVRGPGREPASGAQGDAVMKTLIRSFRYPRRGPGMMWQACADRIRALGGRVLLGAHVTGARWDAHRRAWSVAAQHRDGTTSVHAASDVISSAPLRALARGLEPALPEALVAQSRKLRYRDFITVALMVRGGREFDDQWIYVHEPSVLVGRIQNFKAWSPEMVPDPATNCFGLEYFCNEGDGLWAGSDDTLIARAKRELAELGLVDPSMIFDACVVRQPKAYPVYDADYGAIVAALRASLEERFPTLHLVGRNGMHKYNNQDHAMMTAMLTVENILAGTRRWDVWRVNADAEYLEAGASVAAGGVRIVPEPIEARGSTPPVVVGGALAETLACAAQE